MLDFLERKTMRTKYYFRFPTRAEYRKYTFKRDDGVLKSLEFLVHTTIIEPCLEDFKQIEQENITITEKIGQRLIDIITNSDCDSGKIEVDISIPLCTPRNKEVLVEKTLTENIRDIVKEVLTEYKLI